MARGYAGTELRPIPDKKWKILPGMAPQDRKYFKKFKGLDTLTPLSEMDTDHSPYVVNLVSTKGILTSRVPLAAYGSKPDGPTVLAVDVEMSGLRWPLRWSRDKLYYQLGGGDWTDTVPGVSLTLSQLGEDFVVWPSGAASSLVYSPGPTNNQCVLFSFNPGLGAYTFLDNGNSPSAEHLAVFGNRIVASYCYGPPYIGAFNIPTIYPNRLQWCVKDDDTDWHSEGSGFEDLIVLTSGADDDVQGLYPVTDTTAILVRRSTIWRVDITGFVDTPFQFTLLTDKLGTAARRTIRSIPGGVVFLGYDDVYTISLGGILQPFGIQKIGLPGLYSVFTDPTFVEWNTTFPAAPVTSTVALSWGYYDKLTRLYWLNVKNLGTYVFSFDDQAWTRVVFPFEPWSIAQSFFRTAQGEFHGVYVTADTFAGGTAAYTTRQDPTRTQDVDGNGNNVDSAIEIRTAFVSEDPLRRVQLVEAQLEYEASASQTLIFETSVDGMQSWQPYSTQLIAPTTRPSTLRVDHMLEAEAAQFRVRSTTLGALKLHALHVFAEPSAPINP